MGCNCKKVKKTHDILSNDKENKIGLVSRTVIFIITLFVSLFFIPMVFLYLMFFVITGRSTRITLPRFILNKF